MKEVSFIQQNQSYWKELAQHISEGNLLTPDAVADYYQQLTDDLAYAQTYFPYSDHLINQLNTLAINTHQYIYKNKKEEQSRISKFWKMEVPLAVYKSHKQLFVAFIIFMISIGIGMFSSVQDERFPRVILGDRYVNMTLENIEKGDPMYVYKDSGQSGMSFRIAKNNVQVAIMAYVLGFIGSIFTILILASNGIMVGAFIQFFINKGLAWIALSTIFLHGALELCEIVICGGAGLVLGNSLLFPGTFSRTESLKKGAKRSLKIIIGSIPIIIVAAFIEGYITRLNVELGSVGRSLIIIASFAYVAWYYIYYPIKIAQKAEVDG